MRCKAVCPGTLVPAILALSSLFLIGPRSSATAKDSVPCCSEIAPRRLCSPCGALNNVFNSMLLLVSVQPQCRCCAVGPWVYREWGV